MVVLLVQMICTGIGLTELVENGPAPLGIDRRYLRHYLSVVGMSALIDALSTGTSSSLGGADLRWACSTLLLKVLALGPVR